MTTMWNIDRTYNMVSTGTYKVFFFVFFHPLYGSTVQEYLKSTFMAMPGVVQCLFPLLLCKINTQVGY